MELILERFGKFLVLMAVFSMQVLIKKFLSIDFQLLAFSVFMAVFFFSISRWKNIGKLFFLTFWQGLVLNVFFS